MMKMKLLSVVTPQSIYQNIYLEKSLAKRVNQSLLQLLFSFKVIKKETIILSSTVSIVKYKHNTSSSTDTHKLVHQPFHQSTSSYGFSSCKLCAYPILREHTLWIFIMAQILYKSNKEYGQVI